MTYPGDGRNAVAGIFPQEGAVIGLPAPGAPSPPLKEVPKTAQDRRGTCTANVPWPMLSGEIGEAPISHPAAHRRKNRPLRFQHASQAMR